MTLDPGALQRKVRQLDNDMQATYEMLTDISAQQRRMNTRLSALETRVESLDTKIVSLDTKVDSLGIQVEAVGTQVAEVLAHLRR